MSPPLAEAIDLTHALVSAATAGDWPWDVVSELLRPVSEDSAPAAGTRRAEGDVP